MSLPLLIIKIMDPNNPNNSPSSRNNKANLKICFISLVISEFFVILSINYKIFSNSLTLYSIPSFIFISGFFVVFNEHIYDAIAFIFINLTLIIVIICSYRGVFLYY